MHFQPIGEQMQVDGISLLAVIAMGDGIHQQFAYRFQGVFGRFLAGQAHQAGHGTQMIAHKCFSLAQLFGQRAANFLLDKLIRNRHTWKTGCQDRSAWQPLLWVLAEEQQGSISRPKSPLLGSQAAALP